jgi:hypothetical protein
MENDGKWTTQFLLCRVDELHSGSIVRLLSKRRLIDGHEHFDRRIANKLKNVTADRTSVWLAEYSVHMDGHAIKNRDVSNERQSLDLLGDRDAAVHLLRNVQPASEPSIAFGFGDTLRDGLWQLLLTPP